MSLNLTTIAFLRKYVDRAVATGGISLGGAHDINKYYKQNTIITSGGRTYIAKQDVPAGVELVEGEYWGVFVESSGDKTYDHVQAEPSSHWVIAHNLGKYPSVVTTDIEEHPILGDVIYKDLNTVEINFSEKITGKVHFN